MSTYLMLEDHYINGQYMPAGSTQTTADVGGLLPANWVPTPNVDPLDTPAVAAFYAVGPVQTGFTYIKPATYWSNKSTIDFNPADFNPADFSTQSKSNTWTLTGLGSNQVTYPAVNI